MKTGTVRIGDMRIRAPGLTPGQARQLGEMVARRLAASPLAAGAPRSIGALNIRVESASAGPLHGMADEIVRRIRAGIGLKK